MNLSFPGRPQRRVEEGRAHPSLRRALMLGAFLGVWMLAVIGRLYYLEIIRYVDWVARAQKQQQRIVEVAPERGAIYDRNGQPLAMSLPVDSVFAVPASIPDRKMFAGLLSSVLHLDVNDLAGRLNALRTFCWIKRRVSPEEAARVRSLNLKGIYFEKEKERFYPKGTLAAGVLGYVGLDDKGLAGIEYGLDGEVRGRAGRWLLDEDARRQSFASSEWKGQPGKNVELTLDENIQYIAEKALADAVAKWHAAGGAALVENPSTGEILAMASEPTFDPNHYETASAARRENRAVSWVYEPGSTFKLVTLSAALQEKLARPSEIVDCQMGSIVLAGHVIHDHKRFGDLSVEQILTYSSDVGAIKMGLRLGQDRLYQYARDYGFGEKTGIELPGEEHGLLKPPDRWSGISIGEISIGQEIAVTPLQLIAAYSAVANDGVLIEPHIVRDIYRGSLHDPLPRSPERRVVSVSTAEIMKQMLEQVVELGTGKPAQLRGYSSAGKTGTAQKIDPSGAYSHTHYVGSFVGFAPVEKPAIAVLVAIDTPSGAIYGTEVACPAFKEIAERTLAYLNVPEDRPSQTPPSSLPPTQLAKREREAERPEALASVASLGPGIAWPPGSGSVPAASGVEAVALEEHTLVAVPDFSGLAERRIADQCQELGLDLAMAGTGLAVEQSPAPGAKVPPGSTVWVRFAR